MKTNKQKLKPNKPQIQTLSFCTCIFRKQRCYFRSGAAECCVCVCRSGCAALQAWVPPHVPVSVPARNAPGPWAWWAPVAVCSCLCGCLCGCVFLFVWLSVFCLCGCPCHPRPGQPGLSSACLGTRPAGDTAASAAALFSASAPRSVGRLLPFHF